MKTFKKLFILALLITLSSCFTRTIYVPDRVPVRLREDVKDVKVWVVAEDGTIHEGTMTLREGWFIISLPQYDPVEQRDTEQFEEIR